MFKACNGSNAWKFAGMLMVCSLLAVLVFVGPGVQAGAQGMTIPWTAPPDASKVPNPVKPTPEAIAAGKKSYELNCVVCHGESGKGDGPAAAALAARPANFTDAKLMSQDTDGGLFWKISLGISPMPPWGALPETERWQLVDYIRTFSSKGAAGEK